MLLLYRCICFIVMLCSLSGFVANLAAAYYNVQLALIDDKLADDYSCGGKTHAECLREANTSSFRALMEEFNYVAGKGNAAEAVQNGSEAVAMLHIIFAYALVVFLSVSIMRALNALVHGNHDEKLRMNEKKEREIDASVSVNVAAGDSLAAIEDASMQAAAQQQRRLVIACTIVLVTLPLRVAFCSLLLYSNGADSERNSGSSKSTNLECGLCDDTVRLQAVSRVLFLHLTLHLYHSATASPTSSASTYCMPPPLTSTSMFFSNRRRLHLL
jgi:hypothetical protein